MMSRRHATYTSLRYSSYQPRTAQNCARASLTLTRVAVNLSLLDKTSPDLDNTTVMSLSQKPLKVLIAGAGIGGLVLAVALLKKGYEVQIFERDLTAIRGEGKYRGPIQIQSNALGALEAIDSEVAEEVMNLGCITGDRINGLCDGISGDWYVKFNTFHPAAERGIPITRVISRVSLQNVLAKAVIELGGPNTIMGNSHVVSYTNKWDPSPLKNSSSGPSAVSITLHDGRVYSGDVLVGADGIWSKIRRQMVGESEPHYSEYTCYTGISDFTPADIDVVGYRVFLGSKQYFVSSDVGEGKMQWYAFHKEAAGGSDVPGSRKARLLHLFGAWNDNVVDLIKATPEDDILRRDIYDRPPIFQWSDGRAVLLGDSAHAMQPNLGQGGCMAIEDAYELASILTDSLERVGGDSSKLDVRNAFRQYQERRMLRASAIHGMAGMAAFMASTYLAYLGDAMPGPFSLLSKLKIPHPGRVLGQVVMKLAMPGVLGWVLGGNMSNIERSRDAHCRIADQPKGFDQSLFPLFMKDDDAVIRASAADWLLITERTPGSAASVRDAHVDPFADVTSTSEVKGIMMSDTEAMIGRAGCHLMVEDANIAPLHARVWREAVTSTTKDSSIALQSFDYFVQDLGSSSGTWLNGRQMASGSRSRLRPGDKIEFGRSPSNEVYRVKLQHVSLRNEELSGHSFTTLAVGRKHTHMGDGALVVA
ncbi:hypothetical protein CEUSTIGMA_g615.t1 [Chlamydomonas eustigma]|uniref:Zeaxanthin epoxidase, chloroplastic n=1 Tax=Chlamydomonas eustigma TaxID=1157962 RepID=A0A250WR66_9CHLO|nr:hypothetical protein CEUSTIGMA_g615.t1 [Chlamydomonas eustigma]|eukprot:GAX73162.1 hypothetical protein CEUSTIGMA_g615.t1 [Chlamydomonas eustigma]